MAGAFSSAFSTAYDVGTVPVVAPITDTHDGGYSREEYDALRKRIREAEKAREKSEQAKKRAKQKLLDELERSYRRIVLGEPELAEEVLAATIAAEPQAIIYTEAAPQIDWRKFTDLLDTAGQILAILERERVAMAADEADIEILLLC